MSLMGVTGLRIEFMIPARLSKKIDYKRIQKKTIKTDNICLFLSVIHGCQHFLSILLVVTLRWKMSTFVKFSFCAQVITD